MSGKGMSGDTPSAVSELRIAVVRLARRLRNERQDDHLSPSQTAVLTTLLREGPMTPAQLAAAERVQPPSMTRVVTLEQGGWVVQQPHPDDRRQLLVELTPQARLWISTDHRDGDNWLAERFAALSAAEQDVLVRATGIMNRLAMAL